MNPDVHHFISIAQYSEYFHKDFEGEYLYFILYYMDNGTYCSNFFYWQNVPSGFALSTNGEDVEVFYCTGDAYNIYSTCTQADSFNYRTGEDTIPYKFTYNASTKVITLYYENGTVRWTSPAGVGFETNAYVIEPVTAWEVTEDGLTNAAFPALADRMAEPYPSQYWRLIEGELIHELLPGYVSGEGAFKYASALSKVTIPDGVQQIGDEAFRYSGLKKVELPEDCSYGAHSFPSDCEISIRGEYGQLIGSDGREVLDCYGRRLYVRRRENNG